MYKNKLQKCSCNKFHCIGTYIKVETNIMTKNRGGNKGSEKWIEKKKHCGCLFVYMGDRHFEMWENRKITIK